MPPFLARTLEVLAALAVLSLIAFGLHHASDHVPYPDSFYHIRHAGLYWTAGLFQSEFPWVEYSVIRLCASDLWYGFHLLLAPFTATGDGIAAIEKSSAVWTACALIL